MNSGDPVPDRGESAASATGMESRQLEEALRALARTESRLEAPHHVQSAVMKAWDDLRPHDDRRPVTRWPWVAAAVAAGLMLAAGLTIDRESRMPPPSETVAQSGDVRLAPAAPPTLDDDPPRPVSRPGAAGRIAADPEPVRRTTFVLVGAPITADEQVRVVRMRVARDTLMAMGLRPVDAIDDQPVDVEMLIGEDGVARGLRVGM